MDEITRGSASYPTHRGTHAAGTYPSAGAHPSDTNAVGTYPTHTTTLNGVPLTPAAVAAGAPAGAVADGPLGQQHNRPLGQGRDGQPFGQPRRTLRKRIGSAFAGLAALLAKFGAALKALLVALPNVKLLATGATALVSVAAYSLFWGWEFAAGFVVLLFIHEMGHVIALRREGIKASAPMFIPFMGAAIFSKSLGDNALAEARVGLAGPILGSLGAAAVAVAGALLHSDMLLALAYFGFFINLFNLLPVVPLDGGRAMAAMAPWMWFLGFGALVAMVFVFPNPILFIIILFGGMETYRRWKLLKTRSLAQAAYYRVAPRHRLLVGAVYLTLIVALLVGMDQTHILYSGGHYFGRL